MAFNGFRGTAGGSVQSNYTDQPGLGVPGMIAFASEEVTANIDSYFIGDANGVAAGKFVVQTDPTHALGDFQRPQQALFVTTPENGLTVPVAIYADDRKAEGW